MLRRPLERGVPIVERDDVIALELEVVGEEHPHLRLILDDEHVKGGGRRRSHSPLNVCRDMSGAGSGDPASRSRRGSVMRKMEPAP